MNGLMVAREFWAGTAAGNGLPAGAGRSAAGRLQIERQRRRRRDRRAAVRPAAAGGTRRHRRRGGTGRRQRRHGRQRRFAPAGDAAAPGATRAAVTAALASCSLDLYRAFLPAADALAAATTALADRQPPPTRRRRPRPPATPGSRPCGAGKRSTCTSTARWGCRPPSAGGKDLRDQIYAWPLGTRCFIEQELVAQRYKQPNFATQTLPNVRGLGTLEYLLFYSGTDNECAAAAPINAMGSWAALAADPAELGPAQARLRRRGGRRRRPPGPRAGGRLGSRQGQLPRPVQHSAGIGRRRSTPAARRR